MRFARAGVLAALAVLFAACDTARTVEATAAINDCARCHGFPPPDPHPQGSTACSVCHATSVGPGNVIIPGGTHMDGKVEVTVHAIPYPPSEHGPAANGGPSACASCHGADFSGGSAGVSCNACHATQVPASAPDWRTNCTFCHGTRTQNWTDAKLPLAAPPQAVAGATSSSDPAVGAHQAHLAATTLVNPLPCESCHVVPARVFPGSLDHVEGQPATIAFSALATKGLATTGYASPGGTCAVYCHGAGSEFVNPGSSPSTTASPAWTATTIACNGCHGLPPSTGRHGLSDHNFPCGRCHATVAGTGSTPSITNKALHVNGQKDVAFSVTGTWNGSAKTCSNVACHGGAGTVESWYP